MKQQTGLKLWEQSRTQWLGHAPSMNRSSATTATHLTPTTTSTSSSDTTDTTSRPAAVPLEVDEIIEVVFAVPRQSPTDGPPKFPRTVPLPQMVDILVDLWEAEGLDI